MPTESEPSQRLYWPQLDGLRFFAALLVFIHHFQYLPGVPHFVTDWGWVGVDLFLVLSAFLLTRLLRAELETSVRPNLKNFFIRRICRIWPLHWAFVSSMLLLSLVREPQALNQSMFQWFSHIAFFNNFVIAFQGYWDSLPYSEHLWTISLEEQYYLLVPFVVPYLLRIRGKFTATHLIGAALLVLLMARAVCILLEMPHPFIWTLPLRMDAMLLGTALGLGILDRDSIRRRGGLYFVAGLGLLFAATYLPSVDELGWAQVPTYTVVDVACVLLVMGSLGNKAVGAFLSMPLLRYLGKVSFGIYVYHLVVSQFVRVVSESSGITDNWVIFILALVARCLVASASYELFEKRFLILKRRYTTVESRPV